MWESPKDMIKPCFSTNGISSLTKVPEPSPKSRMKYYLLSRLYFIIKWRLPIPNSSYGITKSLMASPEGPYSPLPIIVQPSFLFLSEFSRPCALIMSETFLSSWSKPSITSIFSLCARATSSAEINPSAPISLLLNPLVSALKS